ncbi:MAG: hypothetical protein A2X31_00810 [Elusimicrobia bacterium GWB2_63_22]|nr:MAG: hypothetical protein A2X31_00810 [Elusimicrobia bacterium GWB2_63_22]
MTCRGTLAVLAACLLSGCSPLRVSLEPEKPTGDREVALNVPFFPDNTDQCGPSALASVLGYWGKPAEPELLRQEIYQARLKGSLALDLLLAAGSRGLSAELVNGSLAKIREELDSGRPLIAFVNAGYSFYPAGHYLVITGYDDRRQRLTVHSGMKRNQRLPYGKFERQWRKTERWALLIQPLRQ